MFRTGKSTESRLVVAGGIGGIGENGEGLVMGTELLFCFVF